MHLFILEAWGPAAAEREAQCAAVQALLARACTSTHQSRFAGVTKPYTVDQALQGRLHDSLAVRNVASTAALKRM